MGDAPGNKDPLIGMTFGGCRLEALLGRGGMGSVYRAHQQALDKPVAVKLLAPQLAADPSFVERFGREARAAARIDHPNVVHVLNVAEENGLHFIVLQFVDGETLEQVLQRDGPLDLPRATSVTRDVAAGLEALHHEGVVHRDIKPANILIGKDGAVKITDFGLARNLRQDQGMTIPGVFMGTPEYVAPEQVTGIEIDHRADLYALGVSYYTMLTGRPPFQADNPTAVLSKQLSQESAPLESVMPGIDPRAAEITRRLLQKDPDARFADAGELCVALEAILSDGSPASDPRPAPEPETDEVPDVEVKGRRIQSRATMIGSHPGRNSPTHVPVIAAGPKKRVMNPGEIVPREIIRPTAPPTPPMPELPKILPPPPPEPPPEPEPPPARVVAPPKPAPRPAAVRPGRARSLGRNAVFWLVVAAGWAVLFVAGTLGASRRGGEFLEALTRPLTGGEGLLLRLGLFALGLGLVILALVLNRAELGRSIQPAGGAMLLIFAGLSLYLAGLYAPATAIRPAVEATLKSWIHPSNLAPLAVWGVLYGLALGSPMSGKLARFAGLVFALASLGTVFVLSTGGRLGETLNRFKESPFGNPAGLAGLAAALIGLLMAFGAHRKGAARTVGLVLVSLSIGGIALLGMPPGNLSMGAVAGQASALGRTLAQHAPGLTAGAFLAYWGGWFLYTRA